MEAKSLEISISSRYFNCSYRREVEMSETACTVRRQLQADFVPANVDAGVVFEFLGDHSNRVRESCGPDKVFGLPGLPNFISHTRPAIELFELDGYLVLKQKRLSSL